MGDIINLRLARKEKTRAAKDRKADENRTKYGRTKTQKAGDTATADRARRLLDQRKLSKED